MKYLKVLLTSCFFLLSASVFAQEKTVTGKVIDSKDNTAMVGVTVTNRTTNKRTTTDNNGNFTLKAKSGDVLVITYVGFFRKETPVGAGDIYNVTIAADESKLNDVVVTAFGIRKEKRSLGYATQEVKGEEIAETQRENFLNSLQGRVAGATVTSTSGAPGASTQIVLRGFNSLSGNNQPLIVVDGLPINNSTFSQGLLSSDRPNRDNDYSNRAADINPDDIESVNVLKGPEATALYGIEAGSGAIVITTKKGKPGKLKLSYDNSFRAEINYRFPEIQQVYNNGANGALNNNSTSALGPKFSDSAKLYDNVHNFFRTGFSQKHNLSFEGGKGGAKGVYRGNVSWREQYGVIPNTYFTNTSARLSASHKLLKNLTVDNIFSYTHNKNKKAARGGGGYLQLLMLWPQDDDIRNYLDANGNQRDAFEDGGTAQINNPLYESENNRNEDVTDRYIYNVKANYAPFGWLNIAANFQVDAYNQNGDVMQDRFRTTSNFVSDGYFEHYRIDYRGYSGTVIATVKKDLGSWLKTTFRVGQSLDDLKSKVWSVRSDSIISKGFFSFDWNTTGAYRVNSRQAARDTIRHKRLSGTFYDVGLNIKDFWYINATGRMDITSTLNPQNNRFFYPSFSTSLILSDLFAKGSKVLSLFKLRGSYAETAKDISSYSDQSVYQNQLSSGFGVGYGFANNSPALRPERQKTYEVGTEVNLFKDRIGLDVAYYDTKNEGVLVEGVRLSYGTGFILSTLNVASVHNQGVEVMLKFMPVKTKKFTWNSSFNFARNWNEVTDLPANLPEFYNSDTWLADYRNGLVKGGPTTSITGLNYLRNNAGDVIIDPGTGYPLQNPNYQVIANRNPKFTVGWNNRFSLGNFSFSFLLDYRHGGDIMNGNEIWMVQRGLSKRTLDRENSRIIPGVLRDGLENTINPTRNTMQIVPYFQSDYYAGRTFAIDYIEKDIRWLWLRDITVRYMLPKRMMDKNKLFSSLSFFLTVTDAFVITNYSGLNPMSNGTTPSTRGVGGFGIDYGTQPNPLGFNFGAAIKFREVTTK